MERRVAQGRPPDPPADETTEPWDPRWVSVAVGLGFVAVALVTYTLSDPLRFYNHFVWQALAFLDGRAAIDYPVPPSGDLPGNEFFQDVLPVLSPDGQPTGRGLIPFPPLPAVILLPFVAMWGIRTDDQLIAATLGALDVGIAWWMLGRLDIRLATRFAATAFFAFGTVFWYAAQLGTTWYFAHVVAVGLTMTAVGLAVGRDPGSAIDEDELPDSARPASGRSASLGGRLRTLLGEVDRRQVAAGLLFGLACTARLSVVFGAPFFVLVGGGGSWVRRGLSAGLGAAVPIGALITYNLVATGHPLHPAYDYLYQVEAYGYPSLNYHIDWGVEDPRYIPQNLEIALLGAPVLFPTTIPAALGSDAVLCAAPGASRGLFDENCPVALPRDTGMSVLLSSPAYLLLIPALRRLYGRSRLVTGAALAVLLIAVFNLMHFSQGWVQVGYRFSNDFAPFALLLVALGIERLAGWRWLVAGLVGLSIAVNFWGVAWGNLLGW